MPFSKWIKICGQCVRSIRNLGIAGAARLALAHFLPGIWTIRVKGYARPVHLRGRTTDAPLAYAVYCLNLYPAPVDQSVKFIIDAGANIGLTSIYFAHHYPQSVIVALEPSPENYDQLCHNVAGYANIRPIAAALWKDEGTLRSVDSAASSWSQQFAPGGLGAEVPTRTISGLMEACNAQGIDILKIDIEGGEKELFADGAPWLRHVRRLFIEVHPGGCWQPVMRALAPHRFQARLSLENLIVDFVRE